MINPNINISDTQNRPYLENTRWENWETTDKLLLTCGSYWLSIGNFWYQWPDTTRTVTIQVHKPISWILWSNMPQEIMEDSLCMLERHINQLIHAAEYILKSWSRNSKPKGSKCVPITTGLSHLHILSLGFILIVSSHLCSRLPIWGFNGYVL
jgi:hypothetical protein